MDVRTQVGVNPFRPLLWGENCRERPYDTAARVAEVVMSIGSIRGILQQVGLRNVLKDYIARGDTRSGFSGLVSQIQNDPELARTMAPTLLRLQDLDNLLPPVSQDFSWGLEQPGITVLRFDTLPNLSAQTFMTQFLLFDLWSEKLSGGRAAVRWWSYWMNANAFALRKTVSLPVSSGKGGSIISPAGLLPSGSAIREPWKR